MKKEIVFIICLMFLTSFVLAAPITSFTTQNQASVNNSQSEDSGNQAEVQTENQGEDNEIQTQQQTRAGEINAYRIKNIQRVQNKLQANAEPGNCPENCRCQGSVTTCQFKNREMTIRAGESGNTIIKVKDAEMKTKVVLYKAEGEVYGIFKNNETRVIKILPDEVKEKIKEKIKQRDCDCEDIELDGDGVYQVQNQKRARLLGFIPVRERVKIQMNSETGEIIKTKTSWWGFLARDVVDEEQLVGGCGTVTPGLEDECCQNLNYTNWNSESLVCE